MKYIWLGIKDYCRDVWHDWLLNRLQAAYPNATIYFYDHGYDADVAIYHWKEGNLRHYIYNRKVGMRKRQFAARYGSDLAEALEDLDKDDVEKIRKLGVTEIGAKRDV